MYEIHCTVCHKTHPQDTLAWRCPCGGPLDVRVEPALKLGALSRRKPSLWRYREAIPIAQEAEIVSFDEGMTPLLPAELAGREVLVKLEYLFPTGSFKDRGASVLVSRIRELGVREVLGDSSGNAAAAIAAYTARAGISCDMYLPADTSPAKVAQVAAYGARPIRVEGGRQAATEAAIRAASATGHPGRASSVEPLSPTRAQTEREPRTGSVAGSRFYASHFWNPFFNQGTKTWAYEVWEQLRFLAPAAVVVPAGHGSLLLGAYKGFAELKAQGRVPALPRLYAVQSEACAPLVEVWEKGLASLPPAHTFGGPTLAEGIQVAVPVRWREMVAAVRESGGAFLSVPDDALPPLLARFARRGLFIEPTSAVPLAGAERLVARRELRPGERVVIPLTGHGLKAADKLAALLA